MVNEPCGETIIASQPIRLAQRDEMGVAVQFPDDFRIAAAQRIERMQLAPMQERGAFALDRIEAPVNRRIGRIAETQGDVAEQGEHSRKSGFRNIDDGVAFVGEATVHHLDNLSSLFERGQEASALRPQTVAQRVDRASAAQDRIEFAEKLVVAHLSVAAAPQAVAQYGESLA